jgi:hypothetical protein
VVHEAVGAELVAAAAALRARGGEGLAVAAALRARGAEEVEEVGAISPGAEAVSTGPNPMGSVKAGDGAWLLRNPVPRRKGRPPGCEEDSADRAAARATREVDVAAAPSGRATGAAERAAARPTPAIGAVPASGRRAERLTSGAV